MHFAFTFPFPHYGCPGFCLQCTFSWKTAPFFVANPLPQYHSRLDEAAGRGHFCFVGSAAVPGRFNGWTWAAMRTSSSIWICFLLNNHLLANNWPNGSVPLVRGLSLPPDGLTGVFRRVPLGLRLGKEHVSGRDQTCSGKVQLA